MDNPEQFAATLMGAPLDKLDARAQRVAQRMAARRLIAHDTTGDDPAPGTLGERAADAVASFGGSWSFVGLFAAVMLAWVGVNALLLERSGSTFDPYPFILLNLFLSMLAAIQAPVILMSQNRQAQKDRMSAGHDYEVNLKAELEIMLLHEKLDQLRESQWQALLDTQREQLRLLAALTSARSPEPPGAAR